MASQKSRLNETDLLSEDRQAKGFELTGMEEKAAGGMHGGHRNRIRERFRREGLDNFEEHEILELLLFSSSARRDTNPLAHDLIAAFGNLRGVLEATPDQLMQVKGIGETNAALISMIVPLFRRYKLCIAEEKRSLADLQAARAYCLALLDTCTRERLYCLCLDAKGKLIGRRLINEGTLHEVAAYPRRVAEAVMNLNASAVILTHNHPGGKAAPSREDITSTVQIQQMLGIMGVTLLDHIIVTEHECCSMLENGYMGTAERGK